MRNTTQKSPQGPGAYGSWAAHLGNNSGTPSDKLAVAGWQGSHWASASSFVVSIFHRCSLVNSNFRIFFKWFSSCQLGTVQGVQLGGLSRMDQSKTACQPDLDWTGLFEPCPEVGIPPAFPSCWFPSLPFPNLSCLLASLCTHLSCSNAFSQADTIEGQTMIEAMNENNILKTGKCKPCPSSATNLATWLWSSWLTSLGLRFLSVKMREPITNLR